MTAFPNTTPQKLLVTGATGFIGSRLALRAHQLGVDVLATGRAELHVEAERLQELRAAGVRVEVGLLQDLDLLERLLPGRDTVIHLAAAQHEAEMPESYFRAVNVDSVRTLLGACRDHNVRRFVYGSTIGVYGDASESLLDEDSPVRPDNVYTSTKLEAESLVHAFEPHLETCIVRIAETYGPGDRRLLKLFRSIARGHFIMIGSGANRRQCIHVDDLARGLMLAAQHPAAVGRTFVFAGTEIMTTQEMVRRIAMVLERRPPRLQLPMWPFVAAAGVMETTLPPLHIAPPLHSRRLDFFRKSFVFSTARAQSLLGFHPAIDFRTGAADTVSWYRARGLLPRPAVTEVADRQSA
ncbi:MAG TPA: NAD(P)-dependent oxidoreductase [Steroidobacter sp.]|uniref:NAD-dependent epimerase/dehydratase family protein n=1 Tax=Steroidobacter sp. TaxID=1978227 RepID=UPI002ED8F12B